MQVLFATMLTMLFLFNGQPHFKSEIKQDDPLSRCLEKSSFSWGSNCSACYNSTKSYRINLKNVCGENVDVKVAVQERTNRWRTFNLNNMAPGDTISSYACEGTGKYVFWTRKAGDKTIIFPTDQEIETDFGAVKK